MVAEKTNREERAEVVLRRGVEFTVTIKRAWYENIAHLVLDPDKITQYKLGQKGNVQGGSCEHVEGSTDTVKCEGIPFTANVGRQEILFKEGRKYRSAGTVFIIFNPFHADSPVYMPESGDIKEYVTEQTGRTYFGDIDDWWDRSSSTQNGVHSDSWKYHQFDPATIDAIAKFIDAAIKSKRSAKYVDKSSPIAISRHLTDVLSGTTSRNIEGLLQGKWPGAKEKDPYEDGKEPGYWTGSRKNFTQWLNSGKTVKYGQCWVFGGVLTTALRALGIPARQLTTFRSAHDVQESPGVFDKIIHSTRTGESIWNYHVWVDAWMARPDLNQPANWNAVDATPQETSYDGEYKMGPAYLPFVSTNTHQDDTNNYDNQFVIGEVNSVHRFTDDDDTTDVGRKVVTKKKGVNRRGRSGEHDITKDYKKCETAFHKVKNDVCVEHPIPATSFLLEMESRLGHRRSLKHSRRSVNVIDSESESDSESELSPMSAISKLRRAVSASKIVSKLKSLTQVVDHVKTLMYGECLKTGKVCSKSNGDDCFLLHIKDPPHMIGEDIHVEFKSSESTASGTIKIVVEAVSNNGQPVENNPVKEYNTASFTLSAADYTPFLKDATTFKIIATSTGGAMAHYDSTMFELSMPALVVQVQRGEDGNELVLSTKNPLSVPLTGLTACVDEPYGDRVVNIDTPIAPNTKWTHKIRLPGDIDSDDVVAVSLNCNEIFSTRGWTQDSSISA